MRKELQRKTDDNNKNDYSKVECKYFQNTIITEIKGFPLYECLFLSKYFDTQELFNSYP